MILYWAKISMTINLEACSFSDTSFGLEDWFLEDISISILGALGDDFCHFQKSMKDRSEIYWML